MQLVLVDLRAAADRVKQIKNEATVNENPLEKLIRELREENERLKTVRQFFHTSQKHTELCGSYQCLGLVLERLHCILLPACCTPAKQQDELQVFFAQ